MADNYPFNEEQAPEMTDIEKKFTFLVQHINNKFAGITGSFLKKLDDRTAQCEFDPRLVDNEPKRDGMAD